MPFVPYNQLPNTARVWIYQSDKPISDAQKTAVEQQIQDFVQQWTSHQQALRAWGGLLHNRFIVLIVDENMAGASGCSIDKSVAFVQQLADNLGVDVFNRWNFAYQLDNEVLSADKEEFAQLFQSQKINADTLVFNNLVKTKGELETAWQLPLGKSWHKNFV